MQLTHQQEALDKTKNFDRVAYYLDMGFGKIFVGSEKMKSYGNNVNLVICQKSKVNDWVAHFEKNYSGKWFRSLGAEKLMEAEEREVKILVGMNLTDREKNDLMFGKLLEAVPNDTVVVDKKTGENREIKFLLSDEQKRLLE